MSCSSPFKYEESASAVAQPPNTFKLQGSYTLPSYTIPGYPICEPTVSCHWGGWQHTDLECSWGWCCCWSTPAIPIWPSITFDGSIESTQTCTAEEAISFTVSGPSAPVTVEEVSYTNNKLIMGIDGTNIDILLPDLDLDVDSSGSFSADVPIGSVSTSFEEDGIGYSLAIDAEFLFCLDPTPPQGWLNIKLSCSMSCTIEGVNYEQQFDVACPIVSVED